MPAAVTPACAGAAFAPPAAPTAVAATVIASINWRRLIFPWSNSSSFVAAKPNMVFLPSSDKRVFAVDRGDLHLISVRIVDVHAALAPRRVGARGFERVVDARVVPIGDRVADVVDNGLRGLFIGAEVARDDERAALAGLRTAEGDVGAAHPLVVVDLRVEDLRVPVARGFVIRAGVGDVIDAEHLETARRRGLWRASRRIDLPCQRHRFAELT